MARQYCREYVCFLDPENPSFMPGQVLIVLEAVEVEGYPIICPVSAVWHNTKPFNPRTQSEFKIKTANAEALAAGISNCRCIEPARWSTADAPTCFPRGDDEITELPRYVSDMSGGILVSSKYQILGILEGPEPADASQHLIDCSPEQFSTSSGNASVYRAKDVYIRLCRAMKDGAWPVGGGMNWSTTWNNRLARNGIVIGNPCFFPGSGSSITAPEDADDAVIEFTGGINPGTEGLIQLGITALGGGSENGDMLSVEYVFRVEGDGTMDLRQPFTAVRRDYQINLPFPYFPENYGPEEEALAWWEQVASLFPDKLEIIPLE